jgi:hypothetical protein
MMRLSYLFERCLQIPYAHIAGEVSYATERIGGTVYLYLEHSNGALDWLRNLDFPSVAYRRDGHAVFRAHRGFLRAHGLLTEVLSQIAADRTARGIVTVGYSHGAALAVLAHEYLWYHREDLRADLAGYGFGCPRVLFGGGRAALAERFARFTIIRNLDDIVTHLPPAAFGYYHVGRLLEIGERGRYSCVDAHRPENIAAELARAEM